MRRVERLSPLFEHTSLATAQDAPKHGALPFTKTMTAPGLSGTAAAP